MAAPVRLERTTFGLGNQLQSRKTAIFGRRVHNGHKTAAVYPNNAASVARAIAASASSSGIKWP